MLSLLKQWRPLVLVLLLVGPIVAYVGFGTIWLFERGWLWIAALMWIAAGTAFSILAALWTRKVQPMMPPLDWDSPNTFSPRDRDAWKIVEEEAQVGESLAIEALVGSQLYVDEGRRLVQRLSGFYHPGATDPLDRVPLVELITAIELAAEDLAQLSRQIPGGDLISLSHWRRAQQMADYVSKANDIYAYVSPILNPLSGLARLGTRELVVKPAWKDMQRNLLRWFFQAYVNRLGVHLIELMSGRLAIGADHYRRLTRRGTGAMSAGPLQGEPVVAAVVGSLGSGKTRLIEVLKRSLATEAGQSQSGPESQSPDPSLRERLSRIRWIEVTGYRPTVEREARRDRTKRQGAVSQAIDADFMILVVDLRRGLQPGDVAFIQAWDHHFIEHPEREAPPALVVVTGVDRADLGVEWAPPYDWTAGDGIRETAVRQLIASLRSTLPPSFTTFTFVGLGQQPPFGVKEQVLPALAVLLHRAERSSLLRQLQALSSRSAASRVIRQVGQQGRQIWADLKLRHRASRRAK